MSWPGSPQTYPQISTHTGAPGDRTSALLHREGATPSSRSPHRSQPSEQGFGNRAGDAPQASPLRASGGVGGQTACWKGAGARQASRPGMQHAHSTHTAAGGRVRGRGELMDTVRGPNQAWVLHTQPHHQDSGGHSTSPGAPGSAPRGGRGKRGWRAGRIWPISHRHCWAGWARASPKSENTAFQGKKNVKIEIDRAEHLALLTAGEQGSVGTCMDPQGDSACPRQEWGKIHPWIQGPVPV